MTIFNNLNKKTRILLTVLTGWFGLPKFLNKEYKTGILYLITLGLFGIGWIYDIYKEITSIDGLNNEKDRYKKALKGISTFKQNDSCWTEKKFKSWCKSNNLSLKNTKDIYFNSIAYLKHCIENREITNIVTLDTETTGVKPKTDKILSLSIIDFNGNTLFNELLKPFNRKRWDDASAINNIYYDDVKDKKTIIEYRDEILAILDKADIIVGYNHIWFDLPILKANGINVDTKKPIIVDCMLIESALYGEWNDYKKDFRWIGLNSATKRINYDYNAHQSLDDTKATLQLFKNYLSQKEE